MLSPLAQSLTLAAWRAGNIVMRHYAAGHIEQRRKDDHSPVTAADEEAEKYILGELAVMAPGVPVIAEEEAAAGRIQQIGERFFLVDPLDGTKEFINRNGEFTINIAEIQDGIPVKGVVYAPAKDRLFIGDGPGHAFEIATRAGAEPDLASARPIHVRTAPADGMIAVASRSHRDTKTDEYLAAYKIKDFRQRRLVSEVLSRRRRRSGHLSAPWPHHGMGHRRRPRRAARRGRDDDDAGRQTVPVRQNRRQIRQPVLRGQGRGLELGAAALPAASRDWGPDWGPD